ncbi:hypothetical protein C1J05_12835 [Sulfitobacter sp. JL08]|uniref:DUF502 domain-containing protein n=1 Tax=Sulfitobacter sp. JL08 TaxID=2070369 RepID=UPI000E0B6A75|nr:DUF502 domain-containing protein [Sulfitobacter sp. JL08]AXI55263.1 hypothetical protein C1J05_12835 [Sulfitobacter sp. JL08]
MKATILGGVLFLIPLAFIAIGLTKAFEVCRRIAEPVKNLIPVDRIIGVAVLDILAVCLIILVCYLAGVLAQITMFSKRLHNVDAFLVNVVPGYAVIKSVVGGFVGDRGDEKPLQPVLVTFDDFDQFAFEVERLDDKVVVFLPSSPSAWSGSTIIVARDRVRTLDLLPHQLVSLLRVMGRGTSKLNIMKRT